MRRSLTLTLGTLLLFAGLFSAQSAAVQPVLDDSAEPAAVVAPTNAPSLPTTAVWTTEPLLPDQALMVAAPQEFLLLPDFVLIGPDGWLLGPSVPEDGSADGEPSPTPDEMSPETPVETQK